MFLVCVLLLCAAGVQALPKFQARIPNGDRVPHPCNSMITWKTVGHTNMRGGKRALNAFGKDFKISKYTWSVELCKKDSDGDGKTNGEELGDPNCTWVPGQTPSSRRVSHPGLVCSGPRFRHAWM